MQRAGILRANCWEDTFLQQVAFAFFFVLDVNQPLWMLSFDICKALDSGSLGYLSLWIFKHSKSLIQVPGYDRADLEGWLHIKDLVSELIFCCLMSLLVLLRQDVPGSIFGQASKMISAVLGLKMFSCKSWKKHIWPVCFCQMLTLGHGKNLLVWKIMLIWYINKDI